MNTIISPLQQRAIDYCDRKQMPKIGRQIAVIAYMHGADEQRQIDITKLKCALNAVMIDTHDKEKIISIMMED